MANQDPRGIPPGTKVILCALLSFVSESRTQPTKKKILCGTGHGTKLGPEASIKLGAEQDFDPGTEDEGLVPWDLFNVKWQEQGMVPVRVSSSSSQ